MSEAQDVGAGARSTTGSPAGSPAGSQGGEAQPLCMCGKPASNCSIYCLEDSKIHDFIVRQAKKHEPTKCFEGKRWREGVLKVSKEEAFKKAKTKSKQR